MDVSRIIDERKVDAFNVKLVAFSFLIVLLDGYDITAISFAAPELIKAWGITDRSALGPVFSASLLGMLFGAPGLGYVGDRYGRRIAIVASSLIFGAFTWGAVLASSLNELMILRFLAGIGIGGLLPNAIALNAEFAPKRFRATMIILMFTGVTFGGALPGVVSVALVPKYGWQVLFVIGGVLPIVAAVAAALALPESIKYLVVKGGRRAQIAALLAKMEPGLRVDANTEFTIQGEKAYAGFSVKQLFGDGLGAITPLLWLLFVINLLVFYFLLSWTPTLLTSANVPIAKAAIATTLFQLGGTVGGLVLARPMDKMGLTPVALLFAASVPVIAAIGYVGVRSEALLMIVVFLGGFCVLGLQFGLNATAAMIYPTSIRSNGAGWALGVGRVGSIAGPLVGGALIAMKAPVQQLYVIAAVPLLVGAIACFVLMRLYVGRFRGRGLGERDTQDARR